MVLIYQVVAHAVADKDEDAEDDVDHGEDEVHRDALLVLGRGPDHEGDKRQHQAVEHGLEHPLAGEALELVGIW